MPEGILMTVVGEMCGHLQSKRNKNKEMKRNIFIYGKKNIYVVRRENNVV